MHKYGHITQALLVLKYALNNAFSILDSSLCRYHRTKFVAINGSLSFHWFFLDHPV